MKSGDWHILRNMQECILKRFGFFAIYKLLGFLSEKLEEKTEKGFHATHALFLEVYKIFHLLVDF